MFKYNYSKITYYFQSLIGYNNIFLLKAILNYNNTISNKNPKSLCFINRNNVILHLTIKRLINKIKYIVNKMESYPNLSDNLKDLSLNYQV